MNGKKKQALSFLGTGIFTVIGLVYIAPILIVLMNSFKKKVYINKEPFKLPVEKTWNSIENYVTAIDKYELLSAVGWTVFITVGSVLVILVCTSMCAWYITRVKTKFTKTLYLLCVFLHGRAVPDGDVHAVPCGGPDKAQHTVGDHHHLSGLRRGTGGVYVCGFVKSIPLEIEEAAMIDGCTPPAHIFRRGAPDHETDVYLGRYPGDDVDLERLPPSVPRAGPEQV